MHYKPADLQDWEGTAKLEEITKLMADRDKKVDYTSDEFWQSPGKYWDFKEAHKKAGKYFMRHWES